MSSVSLALESLLGSIDPKALGPYGREVCDEMIRRVRPFPFSSLEDFFTSPKGVGVEKATPTQRAICRIAQGVPLDDLETHPDVLASLGLSDARILREIGQPRELMILAGIRGGKSMLVAGVSIWSSQTIDVTGLADWETPRYSIVSLEKDNAFATYEHVSGILKSDALRHLIWTGKEKDAWVKTLKEENPSVIGSEIVKHPMGINIEVRVVAGKRAGGSLVSRWSAGGAFEEAPRMVGASEGVVNYDHGRSAIIGRLRDGAMILSVGSPWAPTSPVAVRARAAWGNPTKEIVVIRATGDRMNPTFWTKERAARLMVADPTAYKTDYLAEFADPEETLIPYDALEACTRESLDLAPCKRNEYVAAIDPATRGNAWTLVVGTAERGKLCVALARQWQGSAVSHLSSKSTFREIAELLKPYGVTSVWTDQWGSDPLAEHASDAGLCLQQHKYSTTDITRMYLALRDNVLNGKVELPPDPVLKRDLNLLAKVPTGPGISIRLPETADKRHCDFAPPVILALAQWLPEPSSEAPRPGSPEAMEAIARAMEEKDIEDYERQQRKEWWER